MAPAFDSQLVNPATQEQFADELEKICLSAGFPHYLLLRFSDDNFSDVVQSLHNAPPASRELMHAAGHWSIVRLVERLRQSPLPVHFGAHQRIGLELPGYVSGVAAVSRERRGGVILCFGAGSPELDTSRLVHMLGQVTLAAQLCGPGLASIHLEPSPFSQQELACLQMRFDGLSSKQTAQKLGISFRTVEHHLESARRRCGVRTTMAAAYHACDRGWIQLPPEDAATG